MKKINEEEIKKLENNPLKKDSYIILSDILKGNHYHWDSTQGGKGITIRLTDSKTIEILKNFKLKIVYI